jgi:hypothetical protein
MGVNSELIWTKIEDITVKTIIAAEPMLLSGFDMFVPYRTNCFELLGFDILIDDKHEPWLLEVNLSPSLACDSPIDQKIKSGVLADLFNLTGIVELEKRLIPVGKKHSLKLKENSLKKAAPIQKLTYDSGNGINYYEKKKEELTKEERIILRETEDEYQRRGDFKMIYPSS